MTQPAAFSVHAMELGPMENFVYLVHDHDSDTAAVVDPAWDIPAVNALAQKLGVKITDILLTHSHHDHINGIDELLETHDARVHLAKAEAEFWGKELVRPQTHHGGDEISLGASVISVLHTPGHTPGSACYHIGNQVLTGDTLFVFGCGRCDLRGGDPEQMYQTLKRLREGLPGGTEIRPGHNYSVKQSSTIDEEAAGNPFMHFAAVDDFVHYRMHEHDRVRNSPYAAVLPGD